MHMSYWRFAAMIGTSTVVMFALMYLNTYAVEHALWSQTRMWMALLMGAVMATIMLGLMLNMYKKELSMLPFFWRQRSGFPSLPVARAESEHGWGRR